MTYEEENFILDKVNKLKDFDQLVKETHENNIMLKQITEFLASLILNKSTEDIDDFGRNVLANLLSNQIDGYEKTFN